MKQKQNPRQTFDLTIHSHIHAKEGETVVHVQHNKRDLDAESLIQALCDFLSEYSPVSCEAIDSKQLNVAMDANEPCDDATGDHHYHICDLDGKRCTSTDCLECARNTTGQPVESNASAIPPDNPKRTLRNQLNSALSQIGSGMATLEKLTSEVSSKAPLNIDFWTNYHLTRNAVRWLAKYLARIAKGIVD